MDDSIRNQIINFCNIQLQIMTEKENNLRKEILDCKIQREFLTEVLVNIEHPKNINKRDD
tara:strand:- start:443 stop:622 length:180 start_codon:yes stop_codon:yes gene_type:complete